MARIDEIRRLHVSNRDIFDALQNIPEGVRPSLPSVCGVVYLSSITSWEPKAYYLGQLDSEVSVLKSNVVRLRAQATTDRYFDHFADRLGRQFDVESDDPLNDAYRPVIQPEIDRVEAAFLTGWDETKTVISKGKGPEGIEQQLMRILDAQFEDADTRQIDYDPIGLAVIKAADRFRSNGRCEIALYVEIYQELRKV